MRSTPFVSWAAVGPMAGWLVALPLCAAEPAAGRAGGLVPGSSRPVTTKTREELVREWDLDGDGTIGRSEADVARARMRRQRLEMQLGAGIDPLTGLPRGIVGEESDEPAADEPLFQLPPEPPPETPSRDDEGEPLPGLRIPAPPKPAAASPPAGRRDAAAPTAPPPAPLSARASWLPPQRFSPAVTGGVRAGGLPATPGYGSGAWSDLNAGRRPPPADPRATGATGGLLPTTRPPGRTGAMMLPTVPGRSPAMGAPAAPPPPGDVTVPRITADEIGSERP